MQTRQNNRMRSLLAVKDFLDVHAAKFPDVTTTGARKEFDAVIAEINDQIERQKGRRVRAQVNAKKADALRRELVHNYLAPIVRIARTKLPRTNELEPLRLPSKTATVENVASAARGLMHVAAQYADVFIQSGLPADFIAQLDAAIGAMQQSRVDGKSDRADSKGASAGLRQSLKRARDTVGIIDSFVRVALQDNDDLLTVWNGVNRVDRPIGGSISQATPVTSSVPSPATEAAA